MNVIEQKRLSSEMLSLIKRGVYMHGACVMCIRLQPAAIHHSDPRAVYYGLGIIHHADSAVLGSQRVNYPCGEAKGFCKRPWMRRLHPVTKSKATAPIMFGCSRHCGTNESIGGCCNESVARLAFSTRLSNEGRKVDLRFPGDTSEHLCDDCFQV